MWAMAGDDGERALEQRLRSLCGVCIRFASKLRQRPIPGIECCALAHLPYQAYPAKQEAA